MSSFGARPGGGFGSFRTGGPAGGATGPTHPAPTNPASTGSFGKLSTTTPSTTAAGATGGFGKTPGATGGFGGFGKTAATTPSTTTTTGFTGGFGKTAAGTTTAGAGTTTATGTTGGFGKTPGFSVGGGFGKTAAGTTPAAGTSVGGTTVTGGFTKTAGGFGQVTGGGFGGASSSMGGNAQQQQQALQSLVSRIEQIGNRLHPDSPYCALRHVFYNRVDPSQVRYYRRPEKFDIDLWNQAQHLNPDPENLVPHQARGFPDLKARVDAQDMEVGNQASCLAEAETFLSAMQEKHALQTAVKLEQLKRDSLLLAHRVLKVAAHIEILRARGLSIQPDEDAWRQQLHNLHVELMKPNEYRGRLNELASRVRMQQQSSQEVPPSQIQNESISSHDMDTISNFLQQQQQGLEHLIDILQADMKNLQTLSENIHQMKRD